MDTISIIEERKKKKNHRKVFDKQRIIDYNKSRIALSKIIITLQK